MRDAWPISRRINSGFFLLTIVLVCFAVFAHRSVGALGTGYTEYRDIARQTVSINAYVEDLFEARLAAFQFRNDPSLTVAEEVRANIAEIVDDNTLRQAFEIDPDRLVEIEGMIIKADQYSDAFTEMATLVDQVETANAALFVGGKVIEETAGGLFGKAVQQANPAMVTASARLMQAALRAVISNKQYLLNADPAARARFDESISAFDQVARQLNALAPPDRIAADLATLQGEMDAYQNLVDDYATARQGALTIQTNILDQIGPEVQERLDEIASDIVDRQNILGPEGAQIVGNLQTVIPAVGVLATLIAIAAAFFIGRWINGSVARLAATTDRLASGDDMVQITGDEHDHELGQMARALKIFKEAEVDRKAAEAERDRMREQQDMVMQLMQTELADLAQGNLTSHIAQPFAPEYEDLRKNFNDAVDALHLAMSKVVDTSALISSSTHETNSATSELSQRTENQAATLEETAAALDELTASVKSAAEHAKSVDTSVAKARSEATKNGEIVAQAVSAMDEIAQSSNQITQVISVIDDIAFQTNLLALNAGVEAARAGESGKGFAVVASEVRALAQRSAEAAKEITSLIENSSRHVEQGTQLVGNAGEALSEIITQVNDIASMTSQIATSAEEQSIGLSEINLGVNQLDQVTQQNAAMVQESMSRGDALALESGKLSDLIRRFKVKQGQPGHRAASEALDPLHAAIAQTTAVPATPSPRRVAGGNTAEDIWENF